MVEWIVSREETGRKLMSYLRLQLPKAPNGLFFKLLRQKDIRINGKRAKGEEILDDGDRINVYISAEQAAIFGATSSDAAVRSSSDSYHKESHPEIPVVYEDDQVLILNKPSGVLSQKNEADSWSLVEFVQAHMVERDGVTGFHPGIVNRLDRNTSGIVIAGKTYRALEELNRMIRDHDGQKEYLAITEGIMTSGTSFWLRHLWQKDEHRNQVSVRLDYLGVKEEDALKNVSAAEKEEGCAVCHVDVLDVDRERLLSLVRLRLYTGKSHQLRAQLSDIGHPILGDPKYGRTRCNTFSVSRQMLHAYCYTMEGLDEPLAYLNGRRFSAPPPDDFCDILKAVFPSFLNRKDP